MTLRLFYTTCGLGAGVLAVVIICAAPQIAAQISIITMVFAYLVFGMMGLEGGHHHENYHEYSLTVKRARIKKKKGKKVTRKL